MKTNRFNKKLAVNKTTVANLDEEAMASVKGGESDPLTQTTGANTQYSECWTLPILGC
jgi:hypothetical protein